MRDTVISLFLGFLARSFTSPLCPCAYASHSPYRPPSCASSQCPASSSISVDTLSSSNYGNVLNCVATPIVVGATITQNMSTTATKCAWRLSVSAAMCRYQKAWVYAQTVSTGYCSLGASNNHEMPFHGCHPTPFPHCSPLPPIPITSSFAHHHPMMSSAPTSSITAWHITKADIAVTSVLSVIGFIFLSVSTTLLIWLCCKSRPRPRPEPIPMVRTARRRGVPRPRAPSQDPVAQV